MGRIAKLDNSLTAGGALSAFPISWVIHAAVYLRVALLGLSIIAPSGSTSSSCMADPTCAHTHTHTYSHLITFHHTERERKRGCVECVAEGWKEGDSKKGRAARALKRTRVSLTVIS